MNCELLPPVLILKMTQYTHQNRKYHGSYNNSKQQHHHQQSAPRTCPSDILLLACAGICIVVFFSCLLMIIRIHPPIDESDLLTTTSLLIDEFVSSLPEFSAAWQAALTSLPYSTHSLATLTALINARNPEYCKEILKLAHSALQSGLAECNFTTVKILLRYYSCLAICGAISSAELIKLLETFMSVIHEPGVKQERSDAYVFAVLAAFPWVRSIMHSNSV